MQSEATFPRNAVFPSWWANGAGRFLSNQTENVLVTLATASTIQVVAAADDAAAVIGIAGNWRWNEATVQRAHPGGAAGVFGIWATARAQALSNSPNPGTDNTVRTWDLAIVAGTAAPTVNAGVVDIYRKIGRLWWDGAAITGIEMIVGPGQAGPGSLADVPVGGSADWAGSTDPAGGVWMIEDGRTLNRTDYPALFTALGGSASPWGLPNGTTFNLPDPRGRALVAAGQGAGLTARALAAKFGSEGVILSSAQSGLPDHGHDMESYNLGGAPLSITAPNGKLLVLGADSNPSGAIKGIANNGNSNFQYAIGVGAVFGGARGAAQAHDNIQPSVAKHKIIRTR